MFYRWVETNHCLFIYVYQTAKSKVAKNPTSMEWNLVPSSGIGSTFHHPIGIYHRAHLLREPIQQLLTPHTHTHQIQQTCNKKGLIVLYPQAMFMECCPWNNVEESGDGFVAVTKGYLKTPGKPWLLSAIFFEIVSCAIFHYLWIARVLVIVFASSKF